MTIKTDTVIPYTLGGGVVIDGVLLKGGLVDGVDVSALAAVDHDPVTVDADAVGVLSLSEQVLSLHLQPANTVFAGPISGVAGEPKFRPLVEADISGFGVVMKNPGRVVQVDPTGNTAYTQLSTALAAITDASDSNEYLILVTGEVAETTTVMAKSHVNVLFFPGASVTITSSDTVHGVYFNTLVNTIWAAVDSTKPTIIRAGVVGGAVYGVYTVACANSVRLTNINVTNITTGAANANGITNSQSSAVILTGCVGVGGAGGINCHGIYSGSNSSPTLTGCTGIGGAGGAICHGIYNNATGAVTLTNCTGIGGAGGATCHGIYNNAAGAVTLTNCTGIGGAGGASCYGIYNAGIMVTQSNCTGIGGAGGATCIGILVFSCRCLSLQCRSIGGGAFGAVATATVAASSRQEDAWRPGSTFPYRLLSVSINVTAAAAAGVTLTLRDATGGAGNALSGAVNVSTTGVKAIAVTGNRIITAGSNLYAWLSASDATLAYTVTYAYEICYTGCYAVYHDSEASSVYLDCTYQSNAASAAIYVSTAGAARAIFDGGSARSGLNDAARPKALSCQTAWNPASVYNMVLAGGSTNLTAAAGTANGTCVEV